MEISIKVKNNILIAKMIGELDHHNAEKVKNKLEEEIINRGIKNLVFDLSELAFMDSSGIGMIIGRYKMVVAIGGKVNIICINKQIEKILTLSGLNKIINVYSDYNEAVNNF